MAHDIPSINVELRQKTGSHESKRLRKAGKVPGVVYGHGGEPQSVALGAREFADLLRHQAHVVELKHDNGTEACLIKDVQYNYLGDIVIHADFQRVNLDEEVTTTVAVSFVGEPAALQEAGAVFNQQTDNLEVAGKPGDLPEFIEVDISNMAVGDTIHAGDVALPEGLKLAGDAESALASISVVQVSEADLEAGADDDAAEPEVIGKAEAEGDAES